MSEIDHDSENLPTIIDIENVFRYILSGMTYICLLFNYKVHLAIINYCIYLFLCALIFIDTPVVSRFDIDWTGNCDDRLQVFSMLHYNAVYIIVLFK